MPTLAELEARLDRLRSMRANGVRSVDAGDYRTTFGTDAEMAAAIADIERQIASASGSPPVRMLRFTTSKGL